MQALKRFEVAARVSTGEGSAVAVMTGSSEPPAPVTGQAERIRALSAERYGQDLEAIDDRLRRHQEEGATDASDPNIGRRRRSS